jgi:hypothetical protein
MIINRVIGGNGGETASIFITGLSETDTVTAVNPSGNTISAEWDGTAWVFAKLKEYGTYTVTATDDTNTATQDVLIDVATQYDIEMNYFDGKLYWLGDSIDSITGGWQTLKGGKSESTSSYPYIYANMEEREDSLYCVMSSKGQSILTTVKPISIEEFSTLNIQFSAVASGETLGYIDVSIVAADSVEDNMLWNVLGDDFIIAKTGWNLGQSLNISNKTVSLDISNISGKYIGIFLSRYVGSLNFTLHKLWIE